MKYQLSLALLFCLYSMSSLSEESYTSKYIGQEHRQIKSLSPADIDELKKGGGWGLAKAAELNGFPGPIHILEMGSKINITEEQKTKITKIYEEMKIKAIMLGEQLIRLELKLNTDFADRSITQELLEESIHNIETVRAKLRLTHLSTHLMTPDVLSKEQITLYNTLRGYSKDPCQNIPEGHDKEKWKRHNDCN